MKKIIFITGTSTGFGKLAAIHLAKQDNIVIAGMRESSSRNKNTADELSRISNIEVVDIDVTDDLSVKTAFEAILLKHGRIDVLVNNAGVVGYGLVESFSIDQIKKIFEVNFYGTIRTYQAVLPSMRRLKNGLIINITSGASGHTLPFMVPYLASKFSVESLTEGIQEELRQFNIENVSIQPGAYPTEMTDGSKKSLDGEKADISAEYDPIASEMLNAITSGLFGKMQQYNMDPQIIVDGITSLINMENGTRPLRLPLDQIAEGTDKEFIEKRAEIKARWLEKYMG